MGVLPGHGTFMHRSFDAAICRLAFHHWLAAQAYSEPGALASSSTHHRLAVAAQGLFGEMARTGAPVTPFTFLFTLRQVDHFTMPDEVPYSKQCMEGHASNGSSW